MTKRDYYEILGISKNASDDEIKKAYRKAAVKFHPDKEGGDETKFKEASEAYEVLKDGAKRQRYDQFGHAGVGGNGGASGNPFGGAGGFGGQNVHFDFGDGGLGDIFGQFFGGQSGGNRGPKRGRDVEATLQLTFEEAVFGVEEKIEIEMNDECSHCHGTTVEPGHEMKTCPTCKGAGQVNRVMNTIFGPIQQNTTCETCEGRGKVPEKVCTVCRGSGVERRKKTINLKVPAGIDDGATIRLREHGEAIGNGQKGDLYVHIRVKAHKKFTREGDIILSEQHISMVEAALGTEIDVETVDGSVRMKIPAGTQSGTDFKLSGHGVAHVRSDKRGPHIISIIVDTPVKLSKKQKELLEQFQGAKKHGIF
ncbi:molecular chaperone DnaJ [Candidatus Saccharibacteria bacterium HGW-Saccharibacteria-1]|jgi:molecular chaperone DnaJ|nr:MAG: molecular chaperone DnaJ [Candidatus Saccharibacteria bacterium HGW-Saccharibacteria-1]